MPSTSAPGRAGRAGLPALLLLGAAAVQLVLGARTMLPRFAQIGTDLARYRADAAEPAPNDAVAAVRALPALARELPLDARVLAVSGLVYHVQLEYWFLPRPFRLLQSWPEHLLETIDRLAPEVGPAARQRRDQLEARGTLLTAERLAAQLRWAEFVLVAGAPPPEWNAVAHRAVLLEERPPFALYGVRK